MPRIYTIKFIRIKFIRVKYVLPVTILFMVILILIDKFHVKTYGDYEWYFCDFITRDNVSYIWQDNCPQRAIVTVKQLGRLGNQMWEYASVWAVAKQTGREPYVPSCLIRVLEEVFDNLSIPPLSRISHCSVNKQVTTPSKQLWNITDDDLLLPEYAQLPEYVIPYLDKIVKMFTFKRRLVEESQRLLKMYSKWEEKTIFVGVHVRRTDYIKVLPAVWNKDVVKPRYFLNIMEYFQVKYKNVIFIVLSDDPVWCVQNLQRGRNDVVVINNSEPGQDLAIMAACNHSIIDYGTFGLWGATLAGGETFLYNITWGLEITMSQLMPNWHLVN